MLTSEAYGWRGRADRAAFLVDAAAYYAAVAEVLPRARHSVFILGWDLHSRVRLRSDHRAPGAELSAVLDAAVRANRHLDVYLLEWDFAAIYAAEREPVPLVRFDWRTHPRVRFAFDAALPVGASHHQKIVVVDDALAFAGGLDLTAARWDTPEHRPADPRRRTPEGRRYGPFHDVQAVVTGPPARALGELARGRWLRATGEPAKPAVRTSIPAPWPAAAGAGLAGVAVAVARTNAAYKEYAPVREVAALHRDLIAGARRCLYMENEYFTSEAVAAQLAARLRERHGPEIVLVLPKVQTGWLEQSTMGALRSGVLARLCESDRYGRLGLYAPVNGSAAVNLHAKVVVADEAAVKIGSANLSNRSMQLDSECDLVFLSEGVPRFERAFAAFRTRLLCEHLGVRSLDPEAPLLDAIERLRGGRRTLEPLASPPQGWITASPSALRIIDPGRPFVTEAWGVSADGVGRRPWVAVSAIVGALVVLARPARGRTPLDRWAAAAAAALQAGVPLLPGSALEAYVRPPVRTVPAKYAAAVVGYAAGRALGREHSGRLARRWSGRAVPWLETGTAGATAGLLLVSGVPFGVGAVLAGAARVRVSRFALGLGASLAAAELLRRMLALPRRRRAALAALVVLASAAGRGRP